MSSIGCRCSTDDTAWKQTMLQCRKTDDVDLRLDCWYVSYYRLFKSVVILPDFGLKSKKELGWKTCLTGDHK